MLPIIPPLKPIPKNATKEDRERLYEEYKSDVERLNPELTNFPSVPLIALIIILALLVFLS